MTLTSRAYWPGECTLGGVDLHRDDLAGERAGVAALEVDERTVGPCDEIGGDLGSCSKLGERPVIGSVGRDLGLALGLSGLKRGLVEAELRSTEKLVLLDLGDVLGADNIHVGKRGGLLTVNHAESVGSLKIGLVPGGDCTTSSGGLKLVRA